MIVLLNVLEMNISVDRSITSINGNTGHRANFSLICRCRSINCYVNVCSRNDFASTADDTEIASNRDSVDTFAVSNNGNIGINVVEVVCVLNSDLSSVNSDFSN